MARRRHRCAVSSGRSCNEWQQRRPMAAAVRTGGRLLLAPYACYCSHSGVFAAAVLLSFLKEMRVARNLNRALRRVVSLA